MKDHEGNVLSFHNTPVGRREFIKWAAAAGLAGGALDALFFQPGIALAASMDTTAGLVGYWKFDDGSGSIAVDSSGAGNSGTLTGGPIWVSGRMSDALSFNGSRAEVDINASVLDTSKDYTVAAWVQISNPNVWASAVTQDGANVSGFYLQYTNPAIPDGGRFAFSLISTDSAQSPTTRAISPFSPSTNVWYHLVGVHDTMAKQIKLYVNGTLVDTQSVGTAWNAQGETVIGRGKYNGGPVDFWPGLIDDVRLYNRVLSDADVFSLYHATPPQTSAAFTPLRPPATPLVVRSPYVSTWLAADTLPGTWPTFWTGAIKAMTGMAHIDGTAYLFMGAPTRIGSVQTMTQTNLTITPTQSIFTLQGGGVTLTVTFLSPVEVDNIQNLSVPLSYITATAQSNDGQTHAVRLYFDISGEWAHGDSNELINWNTEQVSHAKSAGTLTTFTVTPHSPQVLSEVNDYPSWGTAVWATESQPQLAIQSGEDVVVRAFFVSQGTLNNTMDANQPRAINDRWPVFAFALNMGTVTERATSPMTLVLGHVREPAVSYLGNPIPPLWKAYWSTWQQMLASTYADGKEAFKRSEKIDAAITADATQVGGTNYAALCALALRQAMSGTELVGTTSQPWLLLKEISSDGNVSTIDVIYPGMPVLVYLNPYLLRLLLDPILAYTETGGWPLPFCVHDLGSHYPNATGHNDDTSENKTEEDMPVEESANMLIMVAAYIRFASDHDATVYANAHYPILKQWADYLVQNALDPGYQNQTDDFTGFIAHSSNLALKGILAIAAMGQVATAAGKTADAVYYQGQATSYISQWVNKSQDSSGLHLKLAYDQDGTWSLKYNAFPDKLLGLNLIPMTALTEESTWYMQHENAFGIPLDIRHSYTKADWEMWTAASTDVASLRQYLIDALYQFVNTSGSRVPFTDWYDTISDKQVGFHARPVIGGVFSLLARLKSKPRRV
ncbi:glutaminase domain-containing protein [Dictyobacter aurantiacus]|uniref:LamG-like jellyroll fold domain-containing protein n=1 Tax=Dictyobacter aurantiacus TaxID=1936993 RepID=A0A401ZQU9_9CHLR|nr:DUF5127 domain-containing protein [Dictyobacter aurantiacus]GCE09241.1 hypothetical protein KDAU_65700 [Dictyobacter aurantiacus]